MKKINFNGTTVATVINLSIIFLLLVTLIITGNPLAILGLYMLQAVPIMPEMDEQEEDQGDYGGNQSFGFIPDPTDAQQQVTAKRK